MRLVAAVLALGLASAGFGQEMATSTRPLPNPRLGTVGDTDLAVTEPVAAPVDPGKRPLRNPRYTAPTEEVAIAGVADSIAVSIRPIHRPKDLTDKIAALKAASNAPGLGLAAGKDEEDLDLATVKPETRKERRKKKREQASMEGAVCGVPAIKGQEISAIKSKVKGCGVPEAVAITSVAGVQLSQAATVDCTIAKALNSWVDEVAQPAFDGKLVELQIAAHYVCRSRNNIKGAKISEHGKGKAIDISAFVLTNGQVLSVRENYNKLLRRIYKAACPYFKTTLGPGSDGYHEDHFHFDTSARDSGSYCR